MGLWKSLAEEFVLLVFWNDTSWINAKSPTSRKRREKWGTPIPAIHAEVVATLMRVYAVFDLSWASIFANRPALASPASRVENSLPSSITGSLAHAA
jgi:hypothetical protein